MDIDFNKAKAYIIREFKNQGDFDFIPPDEQAEMVDILAGIDSKYMLEIMDNGIYDEEVIFDKLSDALAVNYGKYQTYIMRFVDDYMDFMEQYLASVDAIEWVDE